MVRLIIYSAVALLIYGMFLTAWHSLGDRSDFGDRLLNACRDGDLSQIEDLLKSGKDPNASDGSGNSPLTIAAYFGRTEVIALLLKRGAKVEGVPGEATPLYCAAHHGNVDAVRFLLKSGANPNAAKAGEMSALGIAVTRGHPEVVHALLESGGDPEHFETDDWRPLHIALRTSWPDAESRLKIVTLLLDYGADPNADNPEGEIKDSKHDSTIGFGFRRTLTNRGTTPLAIAQSNHFNEIAELIQSRRGE